MSEWDIFRDPARPSWPGVLISPPDGTSVIHVEAGRPVNFADSMALAERITAVLNSDSLPAKGRTTR